MREFGRRGVAARVTSRSAGRRRGATSSSRPASRPGRPTARSTSCTSGSTAGTGRERSRPPATSFRRHNCRLILGDDHRSNQRAGRRTSRCATASGSCCATPACCSTSTSPSARTSSGCASCRRSAAAAPSSASTRPDTTRWSPASTSCPAARWRSGCWPSRCWHDEDRRFGWPATPGCCCARSSRSRPRSATLIEAGPRRRPPPGRRRRADAACPGRPLPADLPPPPEKPADTLEHRRSRTSASSCWRCAAASTA